MQSTAAAVAWRAASSFVRGLFIDPDTSMITISAAAGGVGCAAAECDAVTVTIALTSAPSIGRYSFW